MSCRMPSLVFNDAPPANVMVEGGFLAYLLYGKFEGRVEFYSTSGDSSVITRDRTCPSKRRGNLSARLRSLEGPSTLPADQ